MIAEAAYENPLIPNARLRQIYLAMMRAKLLARALTAKRRGDWAAGMEACLVSTSVDLGVGDLVSDAVGGAVVDFLRGAGLAAVVRGETRASKQGLLAECGAGLRIAGADEVSERLWLAMGAAAGLRALAAQAKSEPVVEGAANKLAGVVVAYVKAVEASAAVWRKALPVAAAQELPIVFVVLPAAAGGKSGAVSALSLACGVAGIAVDGDDAVAIYRVAQESIGRARAGGGPALMECVPYVLPGTKAKPGDAIAGMERYMLQRRVVTEKWLESEARGFARRLARAKGKT